MADFEACIARTLANEGGYVCDPDDPGGATKFGISKRVYPSVDVANLTAEEAKAIYQRDYWDPLYSYIASEEIAGKLFDLGVNLGKGRAVMLLQTACGVTVDGAFGEQTLAAVNKSNPERLLAEFRAIAAEHYALLVADDPKLEKFLHGWMRRAVA
jgi:lysozyme family protein